MLAAGNQQKSRPATLPATSPHSTKRIPSLTEGIGAIGILLPGNPVTQVHKEQLSMRKILLATSVFALSVGLATAQTTGTVTPSTSTTSTSQGTTSTQPGTTSTQTGTTSTTGSGSMGTLQTSQPGASSTGSPAATQGTPGV